MQVQSVPIASVTIGPQVWRERTNLLIRRTERLVRATHAAATSASQLESLPGGRGEEEEEEEGFGGEIRECICRNIIRRPSTARSTSKTPPLVPFPPASWRDVCARASCDVANDYMRRVREVEGTLRRQACTVTEESNKLERERLHLEMMLRSLTAYLTVNSKSSAGRTKRPSTAETDKDGADYFLQCERKELSNLKRDLEETLRVTMNQLQALGQSSKQLLECARERALVLELLPQIGYAGGARSALLASQVAPTSHFTPGCKQALETSMLAVKQSKQLREDIRLKVTSAIIRQKTAFCIVNDGLLKKVAETVDLQKNLSLMSATTRQAMFRKEREINCIRTSYSVLQGPDSNSDITTREKLDRPLVRVYQRHPGTQLPEAAHLIQGTRALRRCLSASASELARLQRARLQVMDDQRGKTSAAKVDASVLRMRRQQVDKRAMPSLLQQEARRNQPQLSVAGAPAQEKPGDGDWRVVVKRLQICPKCGGVIRRNKSVSV
ncbi:tektin-like protein 1 [Nelusetta ayraudi]|uniref:tektin-like protein 1 n=1 Tax=Nelusetta ayraudi TaxID=303726 RepID=UPI003F6FD822